MRIPEDAPERLKAPCLFLMCFLDGPQPLGDASLDFGHTHLTLMPEFRLAPEQVPSLEQELESLIPQQAPLLLIPGDTFSFQGSHTTLRRVQDRDGSIRQLHMLLTQVLDDLGGYYIEPHSGQTYSPHITGWGSPQEVTVDTATLSWHKTKFGQGMVTRGNYRFSQVNPETWNS